MKKSLLIFFLAIGFCKNVDAQDVKLLTIAELENRVAAGRDTTYVINFWATWCAPCVAELPSFEKLQTSFLQQPLKVLLVSLDFKSQLQSKVVPFVKKQNIRAETFLLNEASQQDYIDRISKDWSGAIPATLFINSAKGIKKFYEQEFTYTQLEATYQSLK